METSNCPECPIKHVAIIMDGNGRWAEKRGLPRSDGHRAGSATVKKILFAAEELGIKYMTLYAFSTENWKREEKEVHSLMGLLKENLDFNFTILMKKNIRLRAIGRINDLPFITRNALKAVMRATKKNTGHNLVLALNYGGRAEITDAVKKIAKDVKKGKIDPEKIDDSIFSSYLYAPDIPDPDLLIRTSGELRLSNFLLWQLSYTEMWVTEKCWPDFEKEDLIEAINAFSSRDRRFGAVPKVVQNN